MKQNILLIEDDEQLRAALVRLLERSGYEVIQAENGRDGLKQMSLHSADLVITDMIMPEMEGVETILALRRGFPSAKIIAISGGGRSSAECYLKIAQELGVHKILTKPLMPELLLETIRVLIPPAAA